MKLQTTASQRKQMKRIQEYRLSRKKVNGLITYEAKVQYERVITK